MGYPSVNDNFVSIHNELNVKIFLNLLIFHKKVNDNSTEKVYFNLKLYKLVYHSHSSKLYFGVRFYDGLAHNCKGGST